MAIFLGASVFLVSVLGIFMIALLHYWVIGCLLIVALFIYAIWPER